jgi:hypothetical protein
MVADESAFGQVPQWRLMFVNPFTGKRKYAWHLTKNSSGKIYLSALAADCCCWEQPRPLLPMMATIVPTQFMPV